MKKKLHEQSSHYKNLSEDKKQNWLSIKKKRFIIIQGNYFKFGKVYETFYFLSIFEKFSFNKQIMCEEV